MKIFWTAIKLFLVLTVITGIAYPVLIYGLAQAIFPLKANGSLITVNQKIIGSRLIGQPFGNAGYFTSRPSAVSYDPMPSGGSNDGLTSRNLIRKVEDRRMRFIEFNGLDSLTAVPAEMVFASSSGLDPDISPEAARLQVQRIARARNLTDIQKEMLLKGIDELTEFPPFFYPGCKRVNVLLLNLYTDQIK